MGFLNNLVDWIVAFATGFFGNVLAHDFCEIAPVISMKLIRTAASKLPPSIRERYLEEWSADLQDQRGTIAKLVWALGCFTSAYSMRRAASVDMRRRRSIQFILENDEVLVLSGPSFAAFYSILKVGVRVHKWLPKEVRWVAMAMATRTAELRWRRYGRPDYGGVVRLMEYLVKHSEFPKTVTGLQDGKVVQTFEVNR